MIRLEAEETNTAEEVSISSTVSTQDRSSKKNATYSDALTSASEKFTSDEDEEIHEDNISNKSKQPTRQQDSNEAAPSSDISGGFTATTEASAGSTSGPDTSGKEENDLLSTKIDNLFEESQGISD